MSRPGFVQGTEKKPDNFEGATHTRLCALLLRGRRIPFIKILFTVPLSLFFDLVAVPWDAVHLSGILLSYPHNTGAAAAAIASVVADK